MKSSDVSVYVCPQCRGPLKLGEVRRATGQGPDADVVDGELLCTSPGCGARHPVVRGIPRFVPAENYAHNFGYQWNTWAAVQVGGKMKVMNRERFERLTGWTGGLAGQKVLEAGCGAGRFSEIALDTGAEVFSFDLSNAVEAADRNVPNPEQRKRHHLCQASIYAVPLPYEAFDKVYCMGVLQHTPDVKKTFMTLTKFVKPGGEIAVDCYQLRPRYPWAKDFNRFDIKYWVRPFVQWLDTETLHALLSGTISVLFDVKNFLVKTKVLRPAAALIPIGAVSYEPEYVLTPRELKEIKVLSAMDMLGPRYDQPQSMETISSWVKEAGLEMGEIFIGCNGVNARARKPA